jgi:hypothetical protein
VEDFIDCSGELTFKYMYNWTNYTEVTCLRQDTHSLSGGLYWLFIILQVSSLSNTCTCVHTKYNVTMCDAWDSVLVPYRIIQLQPKSSAHLYWHAFQLSLCLPLVCQSKIPDNCCMIQGKWIGWLRNSTLNFTWKTNIVLIASRFVQYWFLSWNSM